ncbi:MBOAT family protein [Rhodobacteraceae bacterium WD3A24]|nr:MBOAT family protein [Rhodobacteraceae bacterium WD3A24]
MGFTSLTFFLFVPAVLAVFAALPARWRVGWLGLASLVFYGSFGWVNLAYLAAVFAVVQITVLGLARAREGQPRRAVLTAAIVALIGGLAFSKFGDFALAELARLTALPLVQTGIASPAGFSFYVFMATAYIIDIARGDVTPRGPLNNLAFLAWFPKILAGPIERAGPFMPQLAAGLRLRPDLAVLGLQLILWGLIKKVVIAESLAPTVDGAFEIAAYAPPMELLISLYFFAFQLYCDFSGYTDIAIGLSLLFGLTLSENFRRPYLSRSVSGFWADRWHISLGHWFRDYLYLPLGGSRVGALRRHANLLAVFAASGIWHAGLGYGVGWAFLVWGLMNGVYVSLGVMLRPVWRALGARFPRIAASRVLAVVQVLVTFHLILVSWAFFRAGSVEQAMLVLRRIGGALDEIAAIARSFPYTGMHMLGAGLIVALIAGEILSERRPIIDRLRNWPTAPRWAVWYAGLAALVILGRWQETGFIYMAF